MDQTAQELNSRIHIVDLIEEYGIHLKGNDATKRAICPFHEDVAPSLVVQPYKNWWWCYSCLEENELIWTSGGLRTIGSVQIGDTLLSHYGETKVIDKRVKKVKSLIQVEVGSFRHDPLVLTPEHTSLVIKKDQALKIKGLFWSNEVGVFPRKPKVRGLRTYKGINNIENQSIQIEELPTSSLESDDFLVFPVITDRIESSLPGENIIRKAYNGPQYKRIRELPVNSEIAWLYGMWLAEGHYMGRSICFSLHAKEETTYGHRIQDLIYKYFDAPSRITICDNRCSVICSRADLAEMFKYWFGTGSANKKIPYEALSWKKNTQRQLLEGYLDGDGSQTGASITAATVSKMLAYGIFALAIQIGMYPSIGHVDSKEGKDGIVRKEKWLITLKKRAGIYGFYIYIKNKCYFVSKILRIAKIEEEHVVVDISTTDETFVTKFCSTHNCSFGGKPVDFIMKREDCSYREAIQKLQNRQLGPPVVRRIATPKRTTMIPNYVIELWHRNLLQNSRMLDFCIGTRLWSMDIIETYKIGFCVDHWNEDRQNRLTIPISDPLQKNWYDVRMYSPKPLHGRKVLPYSEGRSAMPYDLGGMDNNCLCLLTEGEPDGLAAASIGIPVATNTSGTGGAVRVWNNWSSLILAPTVLICYDIDEAGRKTAVDVANIFGNRAKILNLPESLGPKGDITDAIRQKGAVWFKNWVLEQV